MSNNEISSREMLYDLLCEQSFEKDYKPHYDLYYEKSKEFLKSEEDYRNFAEYYGKKHIRATAKTDLKTATKLIKTILKHFNMNVSKAYDFFKNDPGLTYSMNFIEDIAKEFSFELLEYHRKRDIVLQLFEEDFPITHCCLHTELEFKTQHGLISKNEVIAYKSGLLDELIRISKNVFKGIPDIEHAAYTLGGISTNLANAIAELNNEEDKQIF